MFFFQIMLVSAIVALTCLSSLSKASPTLFTRARNDSSCHYLPGDAFWPTSQDWADLNNAVGGRLVATVPLGSPCHNPNYNAEQCSALKVAWPYAQTHFASSSSFVAPLFQNQSCDPYTPIAKPCTLGNYVDYAVNVSSAEDVVAAVKFVQSKNVRLVVKNTGHDLLGRSTGRGALGVWTHYLKSISFSNYTSEYYTGPAAKFGAGVQAWEGFEAATPYGLRVMGGTCPSVGLAGGYAQGGGHSMLSSVNGMSADNILEWEVVTADGRHIIATPESNRDLYWALSGGGASTYAIVISVTTKAFKDGVVSAAQVTFASAGISQTTYWAGVTAYHSNLPALVDKGGMAAYIITNQFFSLQPVTFPGRSAADVKTLIQPFVKELDMLNITYNLNITSFPTYLAHYSNYYGPLPYGTYPSAQVQGSRLIPRSVIQNNSKGLSATLQNITSSGVFAVLGIGLNVAHSVAGNDPGSNAVLPAWRDTTAHIIINSAWNFSAPWSEGVAKEAEITNTIVPALEAISPGSGSYINEADPNQPNWQTTFYGANYARLQQVKQKYDPSGLFYTTAGVGSEAWAVQSDGRLCRSGII